jgi:hypothetical protein
MVVHSTFNQSTLPVGCLRSTSEVPGRIPPKTLLNMPSSISKMRKSSRLHACATVHGSRLSFSPTTSRASWASYDRGQAGVWSRSRKYATKTTQSLSVVVAMLAVLNSTVCTDGTRLPPSRMKSGLLSSCRVYSQRRSLKTSLYRTSIKLKLSSRRRTPILSTGRLESE